MLGDVGVPYSSRPMLRGSHNSCDSLCRLGRRSSVVEQRFRKPQVKGSNPLAGSIISSVLTTQHLASLQKGVSNVAPLASSPLMGKG